MFKLNRRQLLYFTGGLALASITDRLLLPARATSTQIQLLAYSQEGLPLAPKILDRLYFLDLNDEPLPPTARQLEAGSLVCSVPAVPFAIALKMPVNGFGEVTLYADNEGRGYSPADFPLNLNWAFARSRLYRVQRFIETNNLELLAATQARLQQAEAYLEAAEMAERIPKILWCNQSLAQSLWAGEEVVLAQAQREIERQGSRPNFRFGCNFFAYPDAGYEYNRHFQQLFNFATVPFYWRSFEPQSGQKNFARVDAMLDWLHRAGITPKGHPLVWFHEAGVPKWIRNKSYREVKQLTYQRIAEIMSNYGARIPYYDIINEANGLAHANELNYSFEQFLELTRIASEASQVGNSQINRIVNSCCLWAENVAYGQPPQISPYQYLDACIAADISFEVIGLQLYYPYQDMFEINRLLDRFSRLGKPIHITELGVSSDIQKDKGAYFETPNGLWHAPWSEAVQADWVEQFYTICYSKPYIEAITWWDLSDQGGFWPHGGLLHEDMTPKESYSRLIGLVEQWRT